MTHHKLANEGELLEKVRHIMYDAHINRHWACNAGCGVHEGTGSPMAQMMHLLTSEVEKAKLEAIIEFLNGFESLPKAITRDRYIDEYLKELSKLQEEQK